VVVSSLFAMVVASFIMIACAALHVNGVRIESAKDAALALRHLPGLASILFGIGLLNASVFSAAILLSAAYVVRAFGWEAGWTNKRRRRFFHGLHHADHLRAAVILLPIESLVKTVMANQILNGVLLPVILM
jgi:Mn2+/Fe2+ NRAMP family transporter